MKTRREFLAGGAALATLVASGKPIRSSLGADNVVKGAEGWTNPYVTDGLVAFWDGDWNAGNGVHGSDKKIVDLSGNWRDLVLSDDCVIGENYFALTPSASDALTGGTVDIPELAGQGELEFRLVAKYNGIASWNRHCFYSSEDTTYELNYAHNGGVTLFPGVLINGEIALQYNMSSISEPTIPGGVIFSLVTQCRQVDYDGRNNYTIWLNDVPYVTSPTGTFRRPSSQSTDLHILKMATSNVDQTGYIYSFAIYNRHLTDDERDANYAVDKERFGI